MKSILLHTLIKQHSILIVPRIEEFELSSGLKSRVYCDLKKTALRGDAQVCLGNALADAAGEFLPTAYAGVALGGCHLASLVACTVSRKDVIYVRKEAKQHGTRKLIDAPDLNRDQARVVLIEDVMTTAGSALKAVQLLQADGLNVVGVVTVVDRRDAWNYSEVANNVGGVPLRALFRIEELVHSDGYLY